MGSNKYIDITKRLGCRLGEEGIRSLYLGRIVGIFGKRVGMLWRSVGMFGEKGWVCLFNYCPTKVFGNSSSWSNKIFFLYR